MKRNLFKAMVFYVLFNVASASQGQVDPFNVYRWDDNSSAGFSERKPWFEWWYYKVIDPDTKEAFFFVYGIVNPWDKNGTSSASRSYVSFGDFSRGTQLETKYSVNDFYASRDETFVSIGDGNQATDRHFFGQIKTNSATDPKGAVSWNINIEKIWAYNATSWATGAGITNIEWYPAQADAKCSGDVTLASGKVVTFNDAPCYQDRNWGRSFPSWWAWIVSNHFENSPDTAVAIGGGKPNYFGVPFPYSGVSIGIKYKGEEIAFRPNDLNPVLVDISFGKWFAKGMNNKYRVEVRAWADKSDFLDLQFTTPTGEVFHDFEALFGHLEVKLFKRKKSLGVSWELVDTLISHSAGIEFGSRNIDSIDDFSSYSANLYRSTNANLLN